MLIINKYLKLWPGGKPQSDSKINSVSDIIVSLMGWILADKYIIYSNIGWVINLIVLSSYYQ